MKAAASRISPLVALVAITLACAGSPVPSGQPTPLQSTTSILRADRLQKMPGSTGFDALETLASYMSRTMRQPPPRFILLLDGARTSNVGMLRSIQASDIFEIRVVGESQSLGNPGEFEIVVTTLARHNRIG